MGDPNPISTVLPPPIPTLGTSTSPSRAPLESETPSLPDRDWEKSPIYLSLSSRLSKTEHTLQTLSAQVASLSSTVKTLSAQALPHTRKQPPGVFSPFEEPDPALQTPFIPPTTSNGSNTDATVAALTTQIAALSTSVAQLQRLQQSQSHISRNNSYTQSQPQQHNTHGPPGYHRQHSDMPFQTPGNVNIHGGLVSPAISSATGFGGRPNMGRSVSTNVVGSGPGMALGMNGDVEGGHGANGERGKWGAPKFGQNAANAPGQRDWSPGPGGLGPLTPGLGGGVQNQGQARGGGPGQGQGQNQGHSQSQGQGTGVATPGGGIVAPKWDHFNLKPELLMGIAKYGIGPPNKVQARVLPFMLNKSDIIAQAPPTQERIIAYVIPALQLCLSTPPTNGSYRGPSVVIITTTVDQAAQCHKLVRSVGGPLGIRSSLAAGASGSSALSGEIAQMQRDGTQLLIGTPAKIAEVISPRGLNGSEVRLLILDEVDQLIARNLYEHVLTVAKQLPSPKRNATNGNVTGPLTPGAATLAPFSPGQPNVNITSPFDPGMNSPFNPASKTPFPSQAPPGPSRFGAPGAPQPQTPLPQGASGIERQTCIFSNTIPTDVINFSQQLQVNNPARVLVRREGGVNSQESVSSVTPGINIKHTYVYLTITPSARSEAAQQVDGPGAIGSGRQNANGGVKEEDNRAKEYKLDMLVKILDDYPLWQAVIHVGTIAMLEAVIYKLGSRQWESLYLAPNMPPPQKKAVLQQWRLSSPSSGPRFLVIFDVNVKPPEIPWSPLVVNLDMPTAPEGYAHRAAAAVTPTRNQNGQNGGVPGQSQVNGVIVSFVQAGGGDVEMLRSIECAYRFKSAEIPSVFHDLFQH